MIKSINKLHINYQSSSKTEHTIARKLFSNTNTHQFIMAFEITENNYVQLPKYGFRIINTGQSEQQLSNEVLTHLNLECPITKLSNQYEIASND